MKSFFFFNIWQQQQIVAELEQEEVAADPEASTGFSVALQGDLSNQPDSSSEGQGNDVVEGDADSTMKNPAFVFNSPDSTNWQHCIV